jgi:adenylate cyclase
MGIEIERRYLVSRDGWQGNWQVQLIKQGYLLRRSECTVRVRCTTDSAWLTIKGATHGLQRSEYEYSIPLDDASEILDELCGSAIVEKQRFSVVYAGCDWSVDVFSGRNEGLILAEIELQHADETFELPEWIGAEVTHDARYANANLAVHPMPIASD